jgi:CHASE3 domain sensor protein
MERGTERLMSEHYSNRKLLRRLYRVVAGVVIVAVVLIIGIVLIIKECI